MKHSLRILDIDDLYILSFLNAGRSLTDASKSLLISQAAITQRMNKISSHLNIDLLVRQGSQKVLTPKGKILATAAHEALTVLLNMDIEILESKEKPTTSQKLELKEMPKTEKKKTPKYSKSDRYGFLGPNV